MLGLALVSLAACSDKPYQPKDIRNPPNLAEDAYAPRGWTWSDTPDAVPARRYGVASPPRVPKAEVLILPERPPAEAWYPTVNALVSHGYTVWLADPAPAPLRAAAASSLIAKVVRKGSSGRLLVLGEGRGAVAALSTAAAAKGVVLWSPVTGSSPASVPKLEADAMTLVGLGNAGVLRFGAKTAVAPADALAQAWIKANPSLEPVRPSYASLAAYEAERRSLTDVAIKPDLRRGVPVWINGGDAAALAACKQLADCRTIAPGVEPMIAAFDELTKDATLGAPPPPGGKKRASAPTTVKTAA